MGEERKAGYRYDVVCGKRKQYFECWVSVGEERKAGCKARPGLKVWVFDKADERSTKKIKTRLHRRSSC